MMNSLKHRFATTFLLACSTLFAQGNSPSQPPSMSNLPAGAIDGRVHPELIKDSDAWEMTIMIFGADPLMQDSLIAELRSGRDGHNKPTKPLAASDAEILKDELTAFQTAHDAWNKKHMATMVSPVSTQTLTGLEKERHQMISDLQGTLQSVLTPDAWNRLWRRVQEQKHQMVTWQEGNAK